MDIRPLDPARWPEAAHLLTDAFLDEPYVIEQYGDDRDDRRTQLLRHYLDEDPATYAIVLAAHDADDDALIGLLQGSYAGRCLACSRQADAPRPDDPADALEWEFRNEQAAAHATQPEHGWVGKLGVAPSAQGRGVGRLLLAAMAGLVRDAGGHVLLLECQPHRDVFYEGSGYVRALRFHDPVGPDASLMRQDL